MAIDFEYGAPNVITEARLRSLMEQGYQAELVAKVDAYRKSAVWYGEWIIRAVDQERTVEKYLVVQRATVEADEIRFRAFKTANGLISFLDSLGCTYINIPMVEGGVSIHSLAVAKE